MGNRKLKEMVVVRGRERWKQRQKKWWSGRNRSVNRGKSRRRRGRKE